MIKINGCGPLSALWTYAVSHGIEMAHIALKTFNFSIKIDDYWARDEENGSHWKMNDAGHVNRGT